MDLSRTLASVAAAPLDAVTLARAGMLRPERPDHLVRMALDLPRWGSAVTVARAHARRDPDRVGLVDERGALTAGELERRSNALARAWAGDGVRAGDRVGLLCRNHRGLIDATSACSKLGAQAVYLNTGFAGPQLADVAEHERLAALAFDAEFTELIGPAAEGRRRYLSWVDGDAGAAAELPTLDDLIAAAAGDDVEPPPSPGGVVLLTSGTTGTPKGAPRETPKGISILTGLLSKIPYRVNERAYIAAPLFHGTGLLNAMLALAMGTTIVLDRRFDPRRALERVAQERCTSLTVVPVMLQRMLELGEDEIARHDLSSLRIIFCAGSALSPELGTRVLDAFGEVLYNFYGSTEVAWATIATPADLRAAPGTAGKPPRNTRVRIYDDAGRELPAGQTGRIFVDNGLQFAGYTDGRGKEVIDGLMATGDVGHFDADGRLFVDGRDDDMIVSGGENVFPQEVEDLLETHESVAEVAVLGVPDEQFGQRLRAFVVAAAGHTVDPEALQAFVKANLARYKVPRDVIVLDELPRNPTGKVLKRELAKRS